MAQGQRSNQVNDFKRNCQIITPIQITISTPEQEQMCSLWRTGHDSKLAACPGTKLHLGEIGKGSKESQPTGPQPQFQSTALKSGKWEQFLSSSKVDRLLSKLITALVFPSSKSIVGSATTFATQHWLCTTWLRPWFCHNQKRIRNVRPGFNKAMRETASAGPIMVSVHKGTLLKSFTAVTLFNTDKSHFFTQITIILINSLTYCFMIT